MKVPTMLTLMRLVVIPFIVILYYVPLHGFNVATAILYGLACFTDWLDGYLARRLGQTTKFGEFLDPVVDKIIVAVVLVLLVSNPLLPCIALPVAIIICREIVVSALREWMAEIGKRASVAVTFVSKIKTASQMVAVITLLACSPKHPDWIMYLGYVLLYIAAGLTLWTMIIYLKIAWPNFEFK